MYLLSILLSILSFTAPQTETFEVEPCEVKIEVSQGDFNKKEKIEVEVIETEKEDSKALYNIRDLEFNGILYNNGKKFTFYSQRTLPGGKLNIPGRHLKDGFVRDNKDFIVLASSYSISKGTIIDTPFGSQGKVYDRCPECSAN